MEALLQASSLVRGPKYADSCSITGQGRLAIGMFELGGEAYFGESLKPLGDLVLRERAEIYSSRRRIRARPGT